MGFFFFFFNSERRIGYKKLTGPDMGHSATSHETHIGLYGKVLTFLADKDVVKSAIFIYQNKCEPLEFTFDRILRSSGKYDSPKIRKGDNPERSLVERIRGIINRDGGEDWYLAWSGLESEDVVFWLIKANSDDHRIAQTFFPKDDMILDEDSATYNVAKDYLLKRINTISIDIQKDIEVKSQIGDAMQLYKPRDIENAERQYRQIGREGEELIEQYLEKEKFAKRIDSYKWVNKSYESGLPYDFVINRKLFVDVKATRFDFEQLLFYSNSEIEFASSKRENSYSVYRVYDMKSTERKFRICSNCSSYMQSVQTPINVFQNELEERNALLQHIKLGIKPTICFTNINDTIVL